MVKHYRDVTPEDERRVNEKLDAKVRSLGRGGVLAFVAGLLRRVKLLGAMLRDPDFKIDWPTRAKIIAGLLYFIMPLDVIPDFIPGVGYIDDAFVIAYLVKTIGDTIERYRLFRGDKQSRGKVFDSASSGEATPTP